ncbi:MAG: hypothetical protein AAGI66_08360 [Cyanobacteria bacterium P01_H01_bin.74]
MAFSTAGITFASSPPLLPKPTLLPNLADSSAARKTVQTAGKKTSGLTPRASKALPKTGWSKFVGKIISPSGELLKQLAVAGGIGAALSAVASRAAKLFHKAPPPPKPTLETTVKIMVSSLETLLGLASAGLGVGLTAKHLFRGADTNVKDFAKEFTKEVIEHLKEPSISPVTATSQASIVPSPLVHAASTIVGHANKASDFSALATKINAIHRAVTKSWWPEFPNIAKLYETAAGSASEQVSNAITFSSNYYNAATDSISALATRFSNWISATNNS